MPASLAKHAAGFLDWVWTPKQSDQHRPICDAVEVTVSSPQGSAELLPITNTQAKQSIAQQTEAIIQQAHDKHPASKSFYNYRLVMPDKEFL